MIYRIILRIKYCLVKYMPIKCNSLHLPTIGLLYFLYFAEHLLPKQARFCDNAGQRFPPGEGCWVISLVRDWIPFPQLRSQVDHIDHFDTSQWITKNIHIMLLINKRKHGTVIHTSNGIVIFISNSIKTNAFKSCSCQKNWLMHSWKQWQRCWYPQCTFRWHHGIISYIRVCIN